MHRDVFTAVGLVFIIIVVTVSRAKPLSVVKDMKKSRVRRTTSKIQYRENG